MDSLLLSFSIPLLSKKKQQERTLEFNTIAENALAKNKNKKKQSKPHSTLQMRSHFMLLAAQVVKGLSDTDNKVARLSKLVKLLQNLCEDPTLQIEDLTNIIKQDLTIFSYHLKTLKSCFLEENPKYQQEVHFMGVFKFLSAKLDGVNKRFKAATEEWSQIIQTRRERMKAFSGDKYATYTRSAYNNSVLPVGTLPESGPSNEGQVVITMTTYMLAQDEYTTSRAATVEMLEKPLVEIQAMFTTLMSLVAVQQDAIERIDTNIDSSAEYIDGGKVSLEEYFRKISSNRPLILKLFGILIVFVIVFILIVA